MTVIIITLFLFVFFSPLMTQLCRKHYSLYRAFDGRGKKLSVMIFMVVPNAVKMECNYSFWRQKKIYIYGMQMKSGKVIEAKEAATKQ